MIQVQVSKPQKCVAQENATDNQKFQIRCLVQKIRGVEENLKGVKKLSHYDAMAYVNEKNQPTWVSKKAGELWKKPWLQHVCLQFPPPHPRRDNETEEEASGVPLESRLVRLLSSPQEKTKSARKQNKWRVDKGVSDKRNAALKRKWTHF